MSTLKTVNIQHPSSSTPAITLDSAGAMTGSFPYPNRNLLYNGAMQVHQRSTSVTGITTAGYYTADRWYTEMTTLGTWTQSVENDAPIGSGFRKSLRMLVTTADASPAAGDEAKIHQPLEGQDLQRILKGTSAAQQLTLSFWVKSNITGTYICELVDADNTRHVAAAYTINAAATWEKKTITFPADTTGAFDNDNALSLRVIFALAAGSNFTSGTLSTAWASTVVANRYVGQTNLASAINNYWQITGVQLETGLVATPFEFKSYGQELRECQRYYIQMQGIGYIATQFTANRIDVVIPFPTTMRAAPSSFNCTSATNSYAVNGSVFNFSTLLLNGASQYQALLYQTGIGGAAGQGGHGTINSILSFSSEL